MEYRFVAPCLRCGKIREIEFKRANEGGEKPCPDCGDRFIHKGLIPVTRIEVHNGEEGPWTTT